MLFIAKAQYSIVVKVQSFKDSVKHSKDSKDSVTLSFHLHIHPTDIVMLNVYD